MESICQSLSDSWPKIYRILSHSFPSLLRGLQGQFDWVKTFVLRAPIYQSDLGRSNQRGLGIQHFRSFKSGLADFQAIQDDLVEHPRKTIYYYYNDGNTGSVDRFTDLVISEAAQADHPKQAWMRSLARAVSHWPAPVTVMYVTPSPRIRAVLSPERLRGLEAIQEMVRSVFVSQGKSDLHWVTNWQIAHQENDYVDQDHFSEQGNALLGDYLRKIREQR